MWVHDLPDICKTGDVVLFSTRDTGAKMIQRLTISEWNHVGMVVKPATIPYLIEWGGGLILQPLVERLHACTCAQIKPVETTLSCSLELTLLFPYPRARVCRLRGQLFPRDNNSPAQPLGP